MSNIVTTGVITPQVLQQAARNLLAVKFPLLIYSLTSMEQVLDAHNGNILRTRQYIKLPVADVPLGNSGIDTDYEIPELFDIDFQVNYYSAVMAINEQTLLNNQEDVLNANSMLLAEQMRRTEDSLMRQALAATASKMNCRFGNNGDRPTEIGLGDFSAVGAALADNDAITIMDSIYGQDRFATAPVANCFVGLGSTKIIPNLNALSTSGFNRKSNYPDPDRALQAEYGQAFNVRVFLSSESIVAPKASRNGADVYSMLVAGMQSSIKVRQNGYSARLFYRPAYVVSRNLQNCELGWKMAWGGGISNEQWIFSLDMTL